MSCAGPGPASDQTRTGGETAEAGHQMETVITSDIRREDVTRESGLEADQT